MMTVDNIKSLIILVLLLALVLLNECNRPRTHSETVIETKIDTVHTTSIDTVWNTDTIIHDKIIYKPDTVFIDTSGKEISVYEEEFKDSLIEATVTAKVDGVLTNLRLKYIPLFPKYIFRTDTITINKSTEIYKPKMLIYVGADLGGTATSFDLSPSIGLKTKKDIFLYYRHGLLSKSHNVGVMMPIKL